MNGTLALPSGTWEWSVPAKLIDDPPTRHVESFSIRLERAGATGSVMMAKVAAEDDGTIDERMLTISALNPREREIVVDGEVWSFVSPSRPGVAMAIGDGDVREPYQVTFRSKDSERRTATLPKGVVLGAAKDEDLLRIIQQRRGAESG